MRKLSYILPGFYGEGNKSPEIKIPYESLAEAKIKEQGKPSPLGLAAGGASVLGGVSLTNSGLKDIEFARNTQGIFDDSVDRLNRFTKLDSPKTLSQAHNSYKDLTDIFEQTSRSADETLSKYPTMLKLVAGKTGIEKDKLRQALTKSLINTIEPQLNINNPVLSDTSKDVIGRARAAGLLDYDKKLKIKNLFPQLQQEAARGLRIAEYSAPQVNKVTSIIKNLGRAKSGAGIAATLGGGAWIASQLRNPTVKKAAYSETEQNLSAIASPAAAYMGYLGAKDLAATPRDILVSYGADDRLGAGHATPGKNILNLINEDERFKKLNIRGIEAPSTQGLVSTSNPDALKKRYALGVDTGWGVLDDAYDKNWGTRDFNTGGSKFRDMSTEIPGAFGNSPVHGRDILRNVDRVLKFHPDAPSVNSGNDYSHLTRGREQKGIVGAINRLFTNKGKYFNTTYGDGSEYKGNNLSFVGKAHPAANIDTTPAMSSSEYRKAVAEELAQANPGTTADEWIKKIGNRKIISVTGASRGDSVGARIATLNEALNKSGDDYFILGFGGKNMDAQKAIAEASGDLSNRAGFIGFTKKFVPLAQNADLHFKGMGGSTPYEMMASSGKAPIIRAADEEIFDTLYGGKDYSKEGINKWLDENNVSGGTLNRNAGLAAKQIELANKVLASGKIKDPIILEALREAAGYGDGRNWMNPTRLVDSQGNVVAAPGSHKKLKVGLDGIVDYMSGKNIRAVEFGDDGSALQKLLADFREGNVKGLDDETRNLVRADITKSKEGLAKEILKNWKQSRNLTKLKGAGKIGLSLAALAPMVSGLTGKNKEKPYFKKQSNNEETLATAGNLGMTGLGAKLINNGIKAQLASTEMENLRNRTYTANTWDPDTAADLMNSYADSGKKLMNTNPLIIPSKKIGYAIPLSQLLTMADKPSILATRIADEVVGSKSLTNAIKSRASKKDPEFLKAYDAVMDAADHYRGFSKDPHKQLIHELKYSTKWLNLTPAQKLEIFSKDKIGDSLNALNKLGDSDSARWQVGEFSNKFLSPGRGPYAYGTINRLLGRAGTIGGVALSTLGIGNLIKNFRNKDNNQLKEILKQHSV